jgi:hypothetical protein
VIYADVDLDQKDITTKTGHLSPCDKNMELTPHNKL